MKAYEAKTLIDGYKLGAMFGGHRFVAVPERVIEANKKNGNATMVLHGGTYMMVNRNTTLMAQNIFEDKYGRGEYVMFYYLWQPVQKAIQVATG